MKRKTTITRYDVAEHLRTPEEMAAYLEACFAEADGDAAFVAKALGDVARAKGMSQVARDAGLSRERLCKALSRERSPDFEEFLYRPDEATTERNREPSLAIRPLSVLRKRYLTWIPACQLVRDLLMVVRIASRSDSMHDEVPQLAEIGHRRPLRLFLAIVLCDALDVQERALDTLATDIRDQQWLGLFSPDFGGAGGQLHFQHRVEQYDR